MPDKYKTKTEWVKSLKLPQPEGMTATEFLEAMRKRLGELAEAGTILQRDVDEFWGATTEIAKLLRAIEYKPLLEGIEPDSPYYSRITEATTYERAQAIAEERRAIGVDLYRYREGLTDYVWSMVEAGVMSEWDARKLIVDAVRKAEVEGVSEKLPYFHFVVRGIPYKDIRGEEKAKIDEYGKNYEFYDWLSTQTGWDYSPEEVATLFAKQSVKSQGITIGAYKEYQNIPLEYKTDPTDYEKALVEVKSFLEAKKPEPWYRGEERVPIEGRPETLTAYREATRGLARLGGEWVKEGTAGSETPEELGWYGREIEEPITREPREPVGRPSEAQLREYETRVATQARERVRGRLEMHEEAIEEARVERLRREEWRYAPPRPEYAPAFTRVEAGLEGVASWRQWFTRRYSTLLRQYQATLPKMEAEAWRGLYPEEVERKVEVGWAEYLRGRKPELREEWWAETAEERARRARVFAPPIKMVGF